MNDYSSKIFGSFKGRMFGAWIDADSRSNGYNSGDLIENPAYIIESIIRDELLSEKKLTITTKTSTTVLRSTSLLSTTDDYYNGAYYYNLTTGFSTTISDYTGSTKELTLASADTSVAVNDIVELTSIKYATKLDYASFDVVGNTTNGKRNGWIFARSLNSVENVSDILSRLCFESHCMLSEDNTGKYKLVALDTDTSTTNLIDESQIIGTPSVSRTKTIYNAFDFGYSFNYATGAFEKSVVVDALQSGLVADTTLITNGTFDGDSVAGWSTYGTGGIAGAGEVGTITTSAVNSGEYQTLPISIVSGRTYIISIDQTITSGTWKLRLPKTISHTGTVIGGSAEQTFSGSTLDYSFTASETASCYFMIWCDSSGQEIIVDNITMYEDGFNYASFTPDESSSIVNYGGDAVVSLCGVSQSRYLKRYLFNENLIWHYDTTTINSFVKKFIEWNYSPKIVLKLSGWRGNSFTTGYKPLLAYELGDQCKVDHSILDPDISSVYIFMVVGKSIDISSNEVTLTLMQMR